MKTFLHAGCLLFAWLLAVCSTPAWAAESPQAERAVVERLLSAVQSGDHAAFVAEGESSFRALTSAQFDPLAAHLAPRLKAGYTLTYLGELKQRGYQVTLWRLRFSGGGDDVLATLSTKDARIGGFWLQ